MQKILFDDCEAFRKCHSDSIVSFATRIYAASGRPVRFLDLATGPNTFNPLLIKALSSRLDYEVVLSDISPTRFHEGYSNLEKALTREEISRVKCVLADGNNLRQKQQLVPIYRDDGQRPRQLPLQEVLKDPANWFLMSGYRNGQRVEPFNNESFDIVMGINPYGSIMPHNANAIRESARVLRHGGYLVVLECEISVMNLNSKRTPGAMRGAMQPHVQNVQKGLDAVLEPLKMLTAYKTYKVGYSDPDEICQNGDELREVVFIHGKA